MKRGAEKQLSKDDADVELGDEPDPGQGFRKADETALASRQIRGLPKRASTTSLGSEGAPSSDIPPVPSAPKFGGFGLTTSSSSSFSERPGSFTFTAPSSSSPFGATASSTSPFKPATPLTVSPSASGATKTFASFLGSGSTPNSPAPAAPSSENKDDIDETELKYYTSLRGLNISFLSAISKAIDQDPFTDISDMVNHYKKFRDSVQKDFDERPKSKPAPTPAPAPAPSPSPAPAPAPSSTLFSGSGGSGFGSSASVTTSMPKPVTSFGFGGKTISSSTTTTGFTSTSSSPFSFGSTPSKSAFSSIATAHSFSPAKPKESGDSEPKPTPSLFGSSPSKSAFGAASASPFGKSTWSSEEKEKDTSSSSKSFFGNTPINPLSSSSVTSSAGGFSTSLPKPTPTFSGFGGAAKSGSFGNPVGFGFGSPPKVPDPEPVPTTSSEASTTPAAATATSVFGGSAAGGFGGSSFSGFGSFSAGSSAPSSAGGSQEDVATDDSHSLPTKNHDIEGEGEEDEETTYTTKSKVYRLSKKDDGSQEWKDMGVGMLRLKKHKETESRRVLLRNSSTGKILINFTIYSGLNPTLSNKVVTFVGHDETGLSTTYRVRVPTEQDAIVLKNALDREITAVKAKEEV